MALGTMAVIASEQTEANGKYITMWLNKPVTKLILKHGYNFQGPIQYFFSRWV